MAHLWENDTDSAEIIHSYGIDGAGNPLALRQIVFSVWVNLKEQKWVTLGERRGPLEISLGEAAHQAALAILPDFKAEKAIDDGFCYFAPVKNTLSNVQMIGVARLRYRPHTTRTASWFRNLFKEGPAWIQRYREWGGMPPEKLPRISQLRKPLVKSVTCTTASREFKGYQTVSTLLRRNR